MDFPATRSLGFEPQTQTSCISREEGRSNKSDATVVLEDETCQNLILMLEIDGHVHYEDASYYGQFS